MCVCVCWSRAICSFVSCPPYTHAAAAAAFAHLTFVTGGSCRTHPVRPAGGKTMRPLNGLHLGRVCLLISTSTLHSPCSATSKCSGVSGSVGVCVVTVCQCSMVIVKLSCNSSLHTHSLTLLSFLPLTYLLQHCLVIIKPQHYLTPFHPSHQHPNIPKLPS